jgi:uncharacterized protein (TIGR02145 family)
MELIVSGGEQLNYGSVIVDGEEYKTLNYNGRLWTVENIRNDIVTNYDVSPCGRLYKYSDALYSIEEKLTDGWRLPKLSDFQDLMSFLGTSKPKEWISKNFGGTNKNGFNLELTGYVNQNGTLTNQNVRGYIWTITVHSYGTYYRYNFYGGLSGIWVDDYSNAGSTSKTKLSVRICKDE